MKVGQSRRELLKKAGAAFALVSTGNAGKVLETAAGLGQPMAVARKDLKLISGDDYGIRIAKFLDMSRRMSGDDAIEKLTKYGIKAADAEISLIKKLAALAENPNVSIKDAGKHIRGLVDSYRFFRNPIKLKRDIENTFRNEEELHQYTSRLMEIFDISKKLKEKYIPESQLSEEDFLAYQKEICQLESALALAPDLSDTRASNALEAFLQAYANAHLRDYVGNDSYESSETRIENPAREDLKKLAQRETK